MTDEPLTPDDVPPDTDRYVYRPVTKFRGDAGEGVPAVFSEMTQIEISQP